MKKLYALAILGLLWVSCVSKQGTTAETTSTTTESNTAIVPTEADKLAQGKTLYDNRCGKCHKLFDPKERSKEDWEPILKRMQPKARLTDTDMELVKMYVYQNL